MHLVELLLLVLQPLPSSRKWESFEDGKVLPI